MGLIYYLRFLIWPFGSVWYALKNYSKKWTKNVIWIFVIFYGYTFVLSNPTMDANRLKQKFEIYHTGTFSFKGIVNSYFLYGEDNIDFLQPLIFYLTSLFSSNFQVLMAVLATVFGFFYSRNIAYLLDRKIIQVVPKNYVIFALFTFVIGFWNINGFRFWTSAHIFFYAVIPFIYERRKNRLWFLPLAPILHFSFFFPVLVFLLFLLIRIRPRLYFILLIFSFLLNSLNVQNIGQLMMRILPASFHSKVRSYTSAQYVAQVAEAEASMSASLRNLSFILLNIILIYIFYIYREKIKNNEDLNRLFYFTILFFSAANFASLIPSGHRFLNVAALFALSFLFFAFQKKIFIIKSQFVFPITIPLLLLSIFGFLRLGFTTINLLAVIGNPIIVALVDAQVALIQLF